MMTSDMMTKMLRLQCKQPTQHPLSRVISAFAPVLVCAAAIAMLPWRREPGDSAIVEHCPALHPNGDWQSALRAIPPCSVVVAIHGLEHRTMRDNHWEA